MKTAIKILCLFMLSFNAISQKKTHSFSGTIKDFQTKLPVPNVSVLFSGLSIGGQTDSLGHFSLQLPAKSYQVTLRSLGYKLKIERINLNTDLDLTFYIEESEKMLDEVVISSEKVDANVNRTMMGVEKMSGSILKKLPTLMGEADVIRSLMLLPGVSTVGEGASGFNVRGGNVDQNLVLLDGVPLFNTSHLFGFFTGFNADLVQDLSLYKGGIPSQFGGRASSVLDVRIKQGNYEKWSVQGGLGLIASRILVEGPLWKNKTSIIIGARASISDFYLKYFDNPSLKNSLANFYDMNVKISHRMGKNQTLTMAAYESNDKFRFSRDTTYNWHTQNLNLKHNALIGKNFIHNFTAFISKYNYGISGSKSQFEYRWQPSIIQKSVREDLSYNFSHFNHVDFGVEFNAYTNDAGSLKPVGSESIITEFKMPVQHSREMAAYVGHGLKIAKNINLDYGLRYVFYQLMGPGTFYNYQDNTPRTLASIVDSSVFAKNKVVKSYGGFEPRFSVAFKLDSSFSIKLGFNRMQQFMHLLSNTMAISPADIWKNSNAQLPQQIADQFSIGFFKNFNHSSSSTYETSVELYYKKLQNVIDYIDGANLYLNPKVETELLVGKGYAYGAEFFVKKARGINLTGWISYTYARTFRQIPPTANQIGANFGLTFPANFDTPHNFKFVLNERLTPRLTFNSNFTYNTGRPITYPNGRYKLYAFNDVFNFMQQTGLDVRYGLNQVVYSYGGQAYYQLVSGPITTILDGYSVPSFTLRNAARIPDYMRLDIGLTLDPKKVSKTHSSWNFSIYNILSRQNVYSVYFRSATGLRNQARTYQLSVLGAAIPSLTYNFRF